jgi:hypothetical protein
VDQAHVQITDLRTVQSAIKQSVLPMQNGTLHRPLDDVVIEWRPGLAEEQRQGLPVPQQIPDRLAQPGVRLRSALG